MRGAEYVVMLYFHQVNLNGSLGIWICLKEDDCEICTHFLIHELEFISICPLSSVGLVGCSVMRLERDIYT